MGVQVEQELEVVRGDREKERKHVEERGGS